MAEGFIDSDGEEELEDVGRQYFDELVSSAFLEEQPPTNYFAIPDLVHDLAVQVAGGQCLCIQRGWIGALMQDVRHLFIEADGAENIGMILELTELQTLIITYTGPCREMLVEEIFESVFTRLPNLRVLILKVENMHRPWGKTIFIPESIGRFKLLRYFAFVGCQRSTVLKWPSTFVQLYHLEVLDVGRSTDLLFFSCNDLSKLIKLRHVIADGKDSDWAYIGKLESLQTFEHFTVKKGEGYELCQLKQLNKLRGKLSIYGLENVSSQEDALDAELHRKENLKEVKLTWDGKRETSDEE